MADFTITLTDAQVKCLDDSLPDFQKWLQEAVDGKINQCKKRMLKEWQPRLFADGSVTSIPGTEDGLVDFIFARSDYKNRTARDAE